MNLLRIAAGATLLAAITTPAVAQTAASRSVDIVGTAEAFCSLPTSWQYDTSSSNVSTSQFTGNTWTIPATLLVDDTGNGIVSNSEVALQIRGQAVCNTTHTITLTSLNGGLVNVSAGGRSPAGFQRSRRMTYNAFWRDREWGVFNWTPSAPGDTITYDHGAKAPPGEREFEVRFAVLRDPTSGPMLAGGYTDQLVITISIPG